MEKGQWQKTFDLKDITSVSYQKRSNPSKAVLRFFAKLALSILFLIIAIMIGQLMYDYGMDTSSFEFWCLFFVVPPLLATIIITLISNRVSMLGILIGSETIYIKTSWYKKEVIDHFHNQLIELIDKQHRAECIDLDIVTEELFGGEPIIAEFGNQYRRQYMKDQKSGGGFCMITSTQVILGGRQKVQLMPGIWIPSRKQHNINIDCMERVFFCDHIKLFKIITLDLIITAVLAGIVAAYLIIRPSTYDARIAFMGIAICQAFFWGFPGLAGAKMRQARLVIEATSGTYGFNTKWYTKEEVNQFQKMITKTIETSLERCDKTQQTQYTEPPMIYQQVPEIPHQSAPIQESEQISIKDRAGLLREYNQLLQKGIIDQAEFNRIKAEILSKSERN